MFLLQSLNTTSSKPFYPSKYNHTLNTVEDEMQEKMKQFLWLAWAYLPLVMVFFVVVLIYASFFVGSIVFKATLIPSPSTELQKHGTKVQTAAHCCPNMTWMLMELNKAEENNVFQTVKPFLAQKVCLSQSCNQDILANVDLKKTHCYFPLPISPISGTRSFRIFLLQLQ